MNNNNEQLSETTEQKHKWYYDEKPFRIITLGLTVTISAACATFLIPNLFGYDSVNRYSKFEDWVSAIFVIIISIIIGCIGICIGILYTKSQQNKIHHAKNYIFSILFTCLGLIIGTGISLLLTVYFTIGFFIIVLIVILGIVSCGGIFYHN